MAQASQSLFQQALGKFYKNFWGVFSLSIILLAGLIAIFAYVIAPDNSAYANQMHISIYSQPPGATFIMLSIPVEIEDDSGFFTQLFFGKKSIAQEIPITSYRFAGDTLYYREFINDDLKGEVKEISLTLFNNKSAKAIEAKYINTKTFILGTDKFGRDLLSRLLVGTRVSLSIGLIAVIISLIIGIPLGAVAGYYGGKTDALIMWLINVTWSIPTLLMVIAITLALGKGFWQVFIAVGLTMWVEVARIVRGQVLSTSRLQYVTAGKALGFHDFRIITRHILPNVMAPVIVISAANFAAAILVESGLSFLGIGVQPPMPSWGTMIRDHYQYILVGKAWLALIPGIAIMILVMAFMLFGNAIRDAFDVKS